MLLPVNILICHDYRRQRFMNDETKAFYLYINFKLFFVYCKDAVTFFDLEKDYFFVNKERFFW